MNLMTRDEFREAVIQRSDGKCVICGEVAKDAHHIIERRLWPDGGYYLDNGAALCEKHHIEAEQTVLSCDELRQACGIMSIHLPPTLYKSESYDKWGNVILPNGTRVQGELFYDESVQVILKSGNVLGQFTKYVKYPKTPHLPWSDSVDEETDMVLTPEDVATNFGGRKIVVTEKLDGENTSMYSDYIHARSLDGRTHPSRDWVKNLHASIGYEIPDNWRICGENVYAKHSIEYNGLQSYFFVFAIYENNVAMAWDEMTGYAEAMGLQVVPVLYRGMFDEEKVRACFGGKSIFGNSEQEGYVVRLDDAIAWENHKRCVAKFVRKNHVTTAHNWMNRAVEPNTLISRG